MTQQIQTKQNKDKEILKGIVALSIVALLIYLLFKSSKNGNTEFVTIASDKLLNKVAAHMVKNMI